VTATVKAACVANKVGCALLPHASSHKPYEGRQDARLEPKFSQVCYKGVTRVPCPW
jgi:hypothetical protein